MMPIKSETIIELLDQKKNNNHFTIGEEPIINSSNFCWSDSEIKEKGHYLFKPKKIREGKSKDEEYIGKYTFAFINPHPNEGYVYSSFQNGHRLWKDVKDWFLTHHFWIRLL